MRILALVAVVWSALVLASLCSGQELEKVIPLPDTFFNVDGAEMVTYNPANNQFYLASTGDTTVIAIDGTTCAKVAALHLEFDVSAIGCNPATNKVYIGTFNDRVAVVDGRTNQILTYVTVDDEPACFGCDTMKDKIYCGTYDHIKVIDGTTDKVLTTIDLDNARPVALCCVPSAGKVYCCTDVGPVVIDSRTDSVLTRIQTREVVPLGVVWSAAQNRIYAGSDETLWVFDVATDSVLKRITPEGDWYSTGGLVYSTTLDQVYTMDDMSGELQVIDCGSDSVTDHIPFVWEVPDDLGGLCADPFAGKVYCVDWNLDGGYVTYCDVERREYDHIRAGDEPVALAASTRERRLVCADFQTEDALVLNTENDSLVATVELADWTRAVIAARTADKLYVGCFRGDLLVLDAQTGGLLTRFDVINPVTTLCLGVGGSRLYWASEDLDSYGRESLRVIDTDADTLIAQLAVGHGPTQFYPDQQRKKVYCLNRYDPTITVIDQTTSAVKSRIGVGDWPRRACLDSVAGRLYVACYQWENGISVIDCDRDSIVANIKLSGYVNLLCDNPNRCEAYASLLDRRDTILVIDGIKDTIAASVLVNGIPRSLCFDPVHDRMYCALEDAEVVAIDCDTRAVRARIGVGGAASGLWYNPASGHLFCTVGNAVVVIDPATDSVVATIPVRGDPSSFSGGHSGERVYVDCSCPFISVIRDQLPPSPLTGIAGPALVKDMVYLRSNDLVQLVNSVGREVMTLFPGRNSIGHLAAGVYFTLPRSSAGKRAKLVVVK